ncbi:putative modifying wall lignin-1/2 [Helianthus anomalus]
MEKQHKSKAIYHLFGTTIFISLAIASFAFCVICELKKSKVCSYQSCMLHTHMLILRAFNLGVRGYFTILQKKELRIDGELCYLPQSQAFGYGIAALMCSSVAQIAGTGLFIYCRRSTDFKSSKTSFASILLLLSWASFSIMIISTGTATSMNLRQAVGEGWVDGVCYLVKNGVYIGSGALVLIAMSSTLMSCYLMINKSRAVHAQVK